MLDRLDGRKDEWMNRRKEGRRKRRDRKREGGREGGKETTHAEQPSTSSRPGGFVHSTPYTQTPVSNSHEDK